MVRDDARERSRSVSHRSVRSARACAAETRTDTRPGEPSARRPRRASTRVHTRARAESLDRERVGIQQQRSRGVTAFQTRRMSVVARLRRAHVDGCATARVDDETTSTLCIASDKPFVIGRSADADVRLSEPTVSRKHAVFQFVDGWVVMKNTSALNPVALNDAVLEANAAVRMRHGDVVGIQLTDDEEVRFVFEQTVENAVRSPLRESDGNTPPQVSPVKGSPARARGGETENRAPDSIRKSTPRRLETLSKLTGTPMPSKDVLARVSTLKMSAAKPASPAKTLEATNVDATLAGSDFDEEGSPEARASIVPKSPAKSALKAPENRLAVRPSTIRRRSISFANEEELEAIKWIAPHNGKVELCGRIAPLALNAPRSPRQRQSPSRSPKSAVKALPAPPVVLALPAPETKSSKPPRRSSISFKAVEDGEESETPDASFTRSGSHIQRRDTPRASSRRRSTSPSAESTPTGTVERATDSDVDKTESETAVTPTNGPSDFMSRVNVVATPSSEFKRPAAPHNTPVVGEFSLDGFNLFRTPGETPRHLETFFEEDTACVAIMRAVETLEAEADEDVNAAKDIDMALKSVPTPPSAKKRVDEWLQSNGALAEILNVDNEGQLESVVAAVEPSPAKSVVVRCNRRRNGRGNSGLSLRMQQLHDALKLTRRALSKERKRSAALKEMYLELLSTKQEQTSPQEVKTPKVAMHVSLRNATPPPQKTPKVALQVNVKEATPKTPKIVLNVSVKQPASGTPIAAIAEKDIVCKDSKMEAADKKPSVDHCSVCEVVDKCKTVSCEGCARTFHLKCLKPKLTRTPKGPWTCSSCPPLEDVPSQPVQTEKRARETETEIVTASRSSRRARR